MSIICRLYVDHRLFFETLARKIKNKKLIRLIKKMFKSGIIKGNITRENTLGRPRPQGGIASPLFFDIIMHEVDKDIVVHIKNKAQSENARRAGGGNRSKRYVSLDKKIANVRSRMKTVFRGYENMRAIKQNKKKWLKFVSFKKTEATYMALKLKTRSVAISRTKVKISYTRYADDWVVMTNWSLPEVNNLKR